MKKLFTAFVVAFSITAFAGVGWLIYLRRPQARTIYERVVETSEHGAVRFVRKIVEPSSMEQLHFYLVVGISIFVLLYGLATLVLWVRAHWKDSEPTRGVDIQLTAIVGFGSGVLTSFLAGIMQLLFCNFFSGRVQSVSIFR
jgi:hypothetical protein